MSKKIYSFEEDILTEALDQAYDFNTIDDAVGYLSKKYVLSSDQLVELNKLAKTPEKLAMFNMIQKFGSK